MSGYGSLTRLLRRNGNLLVSQFTFEERSNSRRCERTCSSDRTKESNNESTLIYDSIANNVSGSPVPSFFLLVSRAGGSLTDVYVIRESWSCTTNSMYSALMLASGYLWGGKNVHRATVLVNRLNSRVNFRAATNHELSRGMPPRLEFYETT